MKLDEFVNGLFKGLDEKDVLFCVLRNHEGLPYHNLGRDIDILIRPSDKYLVMNLFRNMPGVRITGYIERAYVFSFFVYGVNWGENKHAIEIDFVTSLSWKGLAYLDVDQVLDMARGVSAAPIEIPIPSAENEALVSFFSSYLIGGWINDKYHAQVRKVFSENRGEVYWLLRQYFGTTAIEQLLDAVITDDRVLALALLPRLRRSLIFQSFSRAPLHSSARVYRHYCAESLIRFTPTFVDNVCILGPDGAGKSTVIERVQQSLINTATKIDVHHLRPRIFQRSRSEGPVTKPHGKSPRSRLLSGLKIFVWAMELWLDHLGTGRRVLTLRIWDRYYDDLLVDPIRYRYGGPMWLARLVGKLIPRPDLWVLLDAPAEALQARKSEVPLEESARQRNAYLKLVKSMRNGVVIDAAQPLEKVVADVNAAVLDFMATRTRKRYG